jgi:single-strand DNA-binding protein
MLNETRLIGYVGKPPKMGNGVALFPMATTQKWTGKDGVKHEKTTWHNIKAFNGLSDIVGRFVNTGRLVLVCGRLDSEKYTDKNGIERTAHFIVADKIKVLDMPQAQPTQAQQSQYAQQAQPSQQAQPTQAQQSQYTQQAQPSQHAQPSQGQHWPQYQAPTVQGAPGATADFDDDIPF